MPGPFNLIPSLRGSADQSRLDLQNEINLLHIQKHLEEARYFLDVQQFEHAHKEYLKIRERYTRLKPDFKSLVFDECQELYRELEKVGRK